MNPGPAIETAWTRSDGVFEITSSVPIDWVGPDQDLSGLDAQASEGDTLKGLLKRQMKKGGVFDLEKGTAFTKQTFALLREFESTGKAPFDFVGNIEGHHLFDTRLDFAIRDWARRSAPVRRVLRASEDQRLQALRAMFERHGFSDLDAVARARILYYMQIGYDDAQLDEPMETRKMLVPAYLRGFTGQEPTPEEIEALRVYAQSLDSKSRK